MKQGKLRKLEGGMVSFFCPGCEEYHGIPIEGSNAWGFNGNFDKPTFTPSIKVTHRHPKGFTNDNPAPKGWKGPDVEDICHSFVTDGKIQYLNDCTHKLAGQTIELPDEED